MSFHDSGDFNRNRRPLSQQEINTTARRIENIVGDPARAEFSDNEFNKWSERQVDRTTDMGGNIVNTHIEPFKPKVTRQDLNLDGSVGDNADNARRDVFAAKKVLSKAGAFDFDPGNEPTVEPNDRFKNAIRTFQAGNDLKVDGKIFPGGPTIHMLGRTAIGQEDGMPSGFDASAFKQNTGRDPNLTLSGNNIFGIPDEEGGGAGSSRTQEAMVPGQLSPPGQSGSGDGTLPQAPQLPPILPLPKLRRLPPGVKKAFKRFIEGFPNIPEKQEKPDIRTRPALIYRYPDGRVYVAMTFQGKIQRSEAGPGKVQPFPIDTEHRVKSLNESLSKSSKQNYPKLSDRRSFQERNAAGEESYVYGPVKDKTGKVWHVPLVDPSTRDFVGRSVKLLRAPGGKPIFLTLAQIDSMGLRKWHMVEK